MIILYWIYHSMLQFGCILLLTRDENKWVSNLTSWRAETKLLWKKIKSKSLEELRSLVTQTDDIKLVMDAFLIALGYDTEKKRKKTIKDISKALLDPLEKVETLKIEDISFEQWKLIQEKIEWNSANISF